MSAGWAKLPQLRPTDVRKQEDFFLPPSNNYLSTKIQSIWNSILWHTYCPFQAYSFKSKVLWERTSNCYLLDDMWMGSSDFALSQNCLFLIFWLSDVKMRWVRHKGSGKTCWFLPFPNHLFSPPSPHPYYQLSLSGSSPHLYFGNKFLLCPPAPVTHPSNLSFTLSLEWRF